MATEMPIVRHFIACEEVIVEPDGRDVTLRNLIHAVALRPGESFPCRCERMALYALLTNGRGVHDITVEMAVVERGDARTLYRPPGRRIDLGQDPTAVLGLPIPLNNVVFRDRGQYGFYLVCDGRTVAEEYVTVR